MNIILFYGHETQICVAYTQDSITNSCFRCLQSPQRKSTPKKQCSWKYAPFSKVKCERLIPFCKWFASNHCHYKIAVKCQNLINNQIFSISVASIYLIQLIQMAETMSTINECNVKHATAYLKCCIDSKRCRLFYDTPRPTNIYMERERRLQSIWGMQKLKCEAHLKRSTFNAKRIIIGRCQVNEFKRLCYLLEISSNELSIKFSENNQLKRL